MFKKVNGLFRVFVSFFPKYRFKPYLAPSEDKIALIIFTYINKYTTLTFFVIKV